MAEIPSKTTSTYTPDNLIAGGNVGPVTESGTLVSGQNLARGVLLGKITSGGKLTACLAASNDGSQNPYGILVDACDASGGDAVCGVYVAGEFNVNSITFGTGNTAASVAAALRDLGIFLKTPPLG